MQYRKADITKAQFDAQPRTGTDIDPLLYKTLAILTAAMLLLLASWR